jgi:hypothetical protein
MSARPSVVRFVDKRAFPGTPSDPRHGTANGYTNLDCRCRRCRTAHAENYKRLAHARGQHMPWDQYLLERTAESKRKPCGTESKYTAGCRCDACTYASAEARRRRRARIAANEVSAGSCRPVTDATNRKKGPR